MLTRMLQRRGSATEWNDVRSTAILQAGEIGLETDTGKFKVGDGTTVWINLPYYLPDTNPTADEDRIGHNNADIYSKLRATQTFKGSQILTPEATDASQTPLTVSAGAATSQSAILQRWRTNADGTLATLNASGYFESKGAKFTEDVDMSGKAITGVKDIDSNSTDSYAVNKKYVDEAIAGLTWKAAVNLAATTNVVLTGATNTLVVDGHDPLIQSHGNGYRLLLLNQTTVAENGIYDYFDDGTNYTLTRSEDADTLNELEGASVFVQEGNVYGTSSWVQTDHYLSTFADQQWVQFNGASQITAGNGMTKSGNVLAVGAGDGITIGDDTVGVSSLGIVTAMIAADAVTDEKIADNAVAQANMKDNSVGTAEIINSSVTTDKINTAAVTHDKLATDAVDQSNMQNASIGTDELIDDSVTHAKVADDAVKDINVASDAAIAISKISGLQSALDAKVDDSHVYDLNDLGDVVITSPQPRQVIKYDQVTEKFINEVPSGGISVGITPPEEAAEGDAWFDSTDGSLYVRYNDGTGSPARTNLIENPSFETSLAGWSYAGSAMTSRSTTQWYSGSSSARIEYIASQPKFYYQNVGVTELQAYTASAYVKQASSTSDFTVAIDWRDSGGASISESQSSTVSANTSGWTRASVTADAPAGAVAARVSINNQSDHYIDAVMLEQSATAGSYIEGTVSAGSSSQWVQVKANSALEASILTRMSAVEARNTKIEAANAVRVASQAERDSVYPAPVQGNTVFRADLGYEEKYYAAYNATTNPDGTTGTIGWYRYAGGAPLSQNYVINADMSINQRDTYSITLSTINTRKYLADRWCAKAGDSTNSVFGYTNPNDLAVPQTRVLSVYRPTGSTNTSKHSISQEIETWVSNYGGREQFKNKTLTLSFYARKTAAFSSASSVLNFGLAGTDAWQSYLGSSYGGESYMNVTSSATLTTTWQRFSLTTTITDQYLEVFNPYFEFTPVGTASGSDGFEIAAVQLEEGPVPTKFRTNQQNIQSELAICQRYYQLIGKGITGRWQSSTFGEFFLRLPVKMRSTPTLTVLGSAVFYNVGLASGTYSFTIGGDFTNVGGQLTPTLSTGIGGAVPNHGAIMSDVIAVSAE